MGKKFIFHLQNGGKSVTITDDTEKRTIAELATIFATGLSGVDKLCRIVTKNDLFICRASEISGIQVLNQTSDVDSYRATETFDTVNVNELTAQLNNDLSVFEQTIENKSMKELNLAGLDDIEKTDIQIDIDDSITSEDMPEDIPEEKTEVNLTFDTLDAIDIPDTDDTINDDEKIQTISGMLMDELKTVAVKPNKTQNKSPKRGVRVLEQTKVDAIFPSHKPVAMQPPRAPQGEPDARAAMQNPAMVPSVGRGNNSHIFSDVKR